MKRNEEILTKALEEVSNATGMPKSKILSKRRYRTIINARKILVYVLKDKYYLGWSEIAKLTDFHHSLIMHHYRSVVKNCLFNDELRKLKELVDGVTPSEELFVKKTILNVLKDKYTSVEEKLDIMINILKDEKGYISQYDKLRLESYTLRKRGKETSKDVEKISIHDLHNWKDS